MKLTNLARLNQEFGQFQLPDRGGVRAALKMADAYLELEKENTNLSLQKKMLIISLHSAADEHLNLKSIIDIQKHDNAVLKQDKALLHNELNKQ